MKIIIKHVERLKRWLQKKLYALRVVDEEEYFYQHGTGILEVWGAHALVSCESRLLGNLVRREMMVKVNYPQLLLMGGEMGQASVSALTAYFLEKEDKVISVTLLGKDEEMHYYLLNQEA